VTAKIWFLEHLGRVLFGILVISTISIYESDQNDPIENWVHHIASSSPTLLLAQHVSLAEVLIGLYLNGRP